MSSGAFSRKMYQLKSHVGVSNKTLDTEMQTAKNKIAELQKKFKNVKSIIKKLAPALHATNLMQVEVLTSLKDILDSSSPMGDHVDTVITTFQKMDEGVEKYDQKLANEIVEPLNVFAEQFKVIEKRMDVCHTRRVDMDRYHEKVIDISKKAAGKQQGLAEAQAKYSRSRDLYNYLRNEILVDMDNLSKSFDEIVGPIATILVTAYTNYLNNVNSHWERAIEACPYFKGETINAAHVITTADVSMVLEQNVDKAKAQDAPVQFDNDDSSSSSSSSSDDDKKKKKKAQAAAVPVAKQAPPPVKRAPPPTPKRKEQVRCNYDYNAQEHGELSFREGDIITVLKKDGDWWLGELRGQQGLFPYNYASPI